MLVEARARPTTALSAGQSTPFSINNTWTFQMWPNIVFCKAVGIYFYFYRSWAANDVRKQPQRPAIKLKFLSSKGESVAKFKENLLEDWIPRHNKPDASPIDFHVQLLKPFSCFTFWRGILRPCSVMDLNRKWSGDADFPTHKLNYNSHDGELRRI